MPAGLGGSGYVALTFETAMGTYLDPTTAGTVFIPIINESLQYQEGKYFSPAIKQSTIVGDVKPSYYHVAGDIVWEVDSSLLPYLLHTGRYTIVKSGAGPYTYKYVPSQAGSATTAAAGAVERTASITVVRNGIGFGYAGCVLGGAEYTIEEGVLRMTANIMGLSETTPAALGAPAWATPKILGADAHSVYVAASGAVPAFAAASTDFNGFTFTENFNANPQNRIVANRSAGYISFGETEANYSTELDFVSKAEYDNFKSSATRAVKLESIGDAVAWAASGNGVRLQANRSAYETYEIGLGGMGDLIMASVTGRIIGQPGGDPYQVEVKSTANIA